MSAAYAAVMVRERVTAIRTAHAANIVTERAAAALAAACHYGDRACCGHGDRGRCYHGDGARCCHSTGCSCFTCSRWVSVRRSCRLRLDSSRPSPASAPASSRAAASTAVEAASRLCCASSRPSVALCTCNERHGVLESRQECFVTSMSRPPTSQSHPAIPDAEPRTYKLSCQRAGTCQQVTICAHVHYGAVTYVYSILMEAICTKVRLVVRDGVARRKPTLAASASSANSAMAVLCWSQVARSASRVSR